MCIIMNVCQNTIKRFHHFVLFSNPKYIVQSPFKKKQKTNKKKEPETPSISEHIKTLLTFNSLKHQSVDDKCVPITNSHKGNMNILQGEQRISSFWSLLKVLSLTASVFLNLLISGASKAAVMTEKALKADL